MSEEQIDLLNCPRCGAEYLRAGECPALCAPAPLPPPKYKGPAVVGRTHMGRLAAPVYVKPEDWIGLVEPEAAPPRRSRARRR